MAMSVPTRSSSFSASPQQSTFSSAMRDRAFASTFEDDESEAASDAAYEDRYVPSPLLQPRGRSTFGFDPTKSRSQSLATATRQSGFGAFGGNNNMSSSPLNSTTGQGWGTAAATADAFSSNPLNIPGSRYGDIKPPAGSRYGSLGGALGRYSSAFDSYGGNGNGHNPTDISNMSPFVRDVGQILLDDSSTFRELWAGGQHHAFRDESGGASGTTSRRHSVSIVQPRRGTIIGFNAPDEDNDDVGGGSGSIFTSAASSSFTRGGLMLSDDELADDLHGLNLHDGPGGGASSSSSSSALPPSQPSSLPIHVPLSSHDFGSGFGSGAGGPSSYRHQLGLHIPSTSSFSSRQQLQSPSLDTSSPRTATSTTSAFDLAAAEVYGQPQSSLATSRFLSGQYGGSGTAGGAGSNGTLSGTTHARTTSFTANGGGLTSPISPNGTRQQHQTAAAFFSTPTTTTSTAHSGVHRPRAPSDASHHNGHANNQSSNTTTQSPQALADLGRGVPLHAVPPTWPLYIVEFKAGRTDLFYLPDDSSVQGLLATDVRVGDYVIVEADRGKDLGKVVNDRITLAEVEAFQRQQQILAAAAAAAAAVQQGGDVGQPLSPGAAPGSAQGKKELSPKRIYGKAGPADAQCVFLFLI
jgi:hypothetical protein